MGLYHDVVVPRMCDWAMRNQRMVPYRQRVVGAAEGHVLEIGVGSGLNFRFYGAGVTELLALEPDPTLAKMAARRGGEAARPVRFIEASAEQIPLDNAGIDTIVTTWTLCTIPHAHQALDEMRRVLRPTGQLLFVEHGRAPDPGVERWQNRLTPAWRRFSGGCHLNRPIADLIAASGFAIDRLETGYAPGPRVMTFLYEGAARPN